MKKLICLLLALSMLFTFCSCSGLMKDKTDTEDPDPVTDEDPPATEGTEAPTEVVYEISEADTDGDGLRNLYRCDGNGNFDYVGFYPAGWEGSKYAGYADYTLANIYTRGLDSTAGTIFNDTGHEWDVACSKELTQAQLDSIVAYVNSNKNHDYNLQSYNCTTFAVSALEAGDFKVSAYISKSLWALPVGYAALTFTIFYPYGYSPGNAGYELMLHAPDFIGQEEIQLQDGTTATGVSDFVLQSE